MGIINIPRQEAEAIKSIDSDALRALIDRCVEEKRATAIYTLRLSSCGPYVSNKLRAFERDLAMHAAAKSPKKREETEYDVRKAARDLEFAVGQMQARVATEEQEAHLFRIDDQIQPPGLISKNLRVVVRYGWRESVDQDWKRGSVTFLHDVVFQHDYTTPVPKRKPSAAQQRRDLEGKLFEMWERLRDLGLQAVRDHFRRGGSGADIPAEVRAKPDSHSHHLNNFSARF